MIDSLAVLAEKQELCQLMADMTSASETLPAGMLDAAFYSRYRSMRCEIEALKPASAAFQALSAQFTGDKDAGLSVLRIYKLHKDAEDYSFRKHRALGNRRNLFHSTRPSNAFGILSRGLLLPKVVVDTYGGTRTDVGMLGSGIYFADRPQTSAMYSQPSAFGSRFMFVSEVALGKSFETTKVDTSLTKPPHGMCATTAI